MSSQSSTSAPNTHRTGPLNRSVVVAHPMEGAQVPLGLDAPLTLAGGGASLLPSGMALAPGIDHIPGLRDFVTNACRDQSLAGRDWYEQPPLALIGERGVGKGMAAQWLARHAGVPLFRLPDPTGIGSAGTGGLARPLPAPVLVAMAACRCANPLIVIELDAVTPPSSGRDSAMAELMDPLRNARMIDPQLGTIFDLSHVSWIVELRLESLKTPQVVTEASDARACSFPVLPAAIGDVFARCGTILMLDASTKLEDLRRFDVAIEACAASGHSSPAVLSHVMRALAQGDQNRGHHVPCEMLVGRAQAALANYAAEQRA